MGADDEVNCYQCGSFPGIVTSVTSKCPSDDNFDDFKDKCKLADGQACIKIESDGKSIKCAFLVSKDTQEMDCVNSFQNDFMYISMRFQYAQLSMSQLNQ